MVLRAAPLRVLYWHESLPKLDCALPKWLGEVRVSLQSLLLVGVDCGHPRILDAWVENHIDQARTAFVENQTFSFRKTYVPLPVVLTRQPCS